eukprot:ctg_1989.g353
MLAWCVAVPCSHPPRISLHGEQTLHRAQRPPARRALRAPVRRAVALADAPSAPDLDGVRLPTDPGEVVQKAARALVAGAMAHGALLGAVADTAGFAPGSGDHGRSGVGAAVAVSAGAVGVLVGGHGGGGARDMAAAVDALERAAGRSGRVAPVVALAGHPGQLGGGLGRRVRPIRCGAAHRGVHGAAESARPARRDRYRKGDAEHTSRRRDHPDRCVGMGAAESAAGGPGGQRGAVDTGDRPAAGVCAQLHPGVHLSAAVSGAATVDAGCRVRNVVAYVRATVAGVWVRAVGAAQVVGGERGAAESARRLSAARRIPRSGWAQCAARRRVAAAGVCGACRCVGATTAAIAARPDAAGVDGAGVGSRGAAGCVVLWATTGALVSGALRGAP